VAAGGSPSRRRAAIIPYDGAAPGLGPAAPARDAPPPTRTDTMPDRSMLLLLLLAGAAAPAHATMTVLPAPVPALGLAGVAVTGVVALVIGWWRMRK